MDVENGETISPDDIADIHSEASEDIRAKFNLNVRTRGKTGAIEDYLETRRPFDQNNKI